MAEAKARLRADRRAYQQRRRHHLGEALCAYEEEQIEAEFAARCFRRCGAAERCCRSWWRGRRHGGELSSIATRGANRVPYAAAKGGERDHRLPGKGIRRHGIRVCGSHRRNRSPATGFRATGRSERASPQEQAVVARGGGANQGIQPMKRYGTTEEQAAAILFLRPMKLPTSPA